MNYFFNDRLQQCIIEYSIEHSFNQSSSPSAWWCGPPRLLSGSHSRPLLPALMPSPQPVTATHPVSNGRFEHLYLDELHTDVFLVCDMIIVQIVWLHYFISTWVYFCIPTSDFTRVTTKSTCYSTVMWWYSTRKLRSCVQQLECWI